LGILKRTNTATHGLGVLSQTGGISRANITTQCMGEDGAAGEI
jgi:hypothetical protein